VRTVASHPARDAGLIDAVLLAGPTGSGKTALALELADRFPLEVVSVDSAQVYRGMDIGTAKPSAAVRARIRHHLIDVCEPSEAYSAGRFRKDALELVEQIRARGRVPLLVGGTMLYFRALTKGMAPLPEADAAVRNAIDRRASALGWEVLHRELAGRDPAAAARIRPADGQRIQRALEVLELTGRPLSELQQVAGPALQATAAFAIVPENRADLYAKLDARLLEMMDEGFLEEVRALWTRGDLHPDLPSLRSVGYRQLWKHLEGEYGLSEAVAEAQKATRNLAKRQLTWIRSDPVWQQVGRLEAPELGPIVEVLERVSATEGRRSVW
jgi:tRNA dimethylallyltransferase